MAKAITQIDIEEKTEAEQKKQIHDDILNQIADNHDSIQTTLDIVEELQQAGILDMLKGLLRMREQIGSISIDKINQPSMHHLIKNSFHTIEFIGKVDPEELEKMMNGMINGMERLSKETEKTEDTGMWGLFKTMRDPHVLSALSYMTAFLNGFGEEMGKKETH
ncbi:DUF1641 domain-containing protein [Salibacterium salarium]|uniref:DUF1641 domain-containing protein n=1 Tax=Salibacterium salarium TaxID=284579 RepID=A0A3R9Q2S3_9BACI|nr:DUF1641 domain-containing protein [Salibacterium salarium]RSL32353.1 DUF1641 domain-containing protein [Salibacterium salarium]